MVTSLQRWREEQRKNINTWCLKLNGSTFNLLWYIAPLVSLLFPLLKISECLFFSFQKLFILIWKVHGRSATKRSLSYQTFLQEKGLLTCVPLNLWVTNFLFLVAPSQPWSLQATSASYPSLQATKSLFAEFVFIAFLYFLTQKPIKRVRIKIYYIYLTKTSIYTILGIYIQLLCKSNW